MSPLAIAVVAWLSVNVIVVLLALNWAAQRRRAFQQRMNEMTGAAERYANVGMAPRARAAGPFRSAGRRASVT